MVSRKGITVPRGRTRLMLAVRGRRRFLLRVHLPSHAPMDMLDVQSAARLGRCPCRWWKVLVGTGGEQRLLPRRQTNDVTFHACCGGLVRVEKLIFILNEDGNMEETMEVTTLAEAFFWTN